MNEITESEWLAELQKCMTVGSDEGFTISEWQEKMGRNKVKTQAVIRKLVLSGKMKRGGRFVETDWDGRARTYMVYKLL